MITKQLTTQELHLPAHYENLINLGLDLPQIQKIKMLLNTYNFAQATEFSRQILHSKPFLQGSHVVLHNYMNFTDNIGECFKWANKLVAELEFTGIKDEVNSKGLNIYLQQVFTPFYFTPITQFKHWVVTIGRNSNLATSAILDPSFKNIVCGNGSGYVAAPNAKIKLVNNFLPFTNTTCIMNVGHTQNLNNKLVIQGCDLMSLGMLTSNNYALSFGFCNNDSQMFPVAMLLPSNPSGGNHIYAYYEKNRICLSTQNCLQTNDYNELATILHNLESIDFDLNPAININQSYQTIKFTDEV